MSHLSGGMYLFSKHKAHLSYRRKMLLRSSLTCSSSPVTSSLETREISSTTLCCIALHVLFSSWMEEEGNISINRSPDGSIQRKEGWKVLSIDVSYNRKGQKWFINVEYLDEYNWNSLRFFDLHWWQSWNKLQVPRPFQQSSAISPQKHSILLPLVAEVEH